MKKFLLFSALFQLTVISYSQEVIPLYKDVIPNSKPVKNEEVSEIEPNSHILIISKVTQPTLTIFLAPKEKATGTAVIICPGGGYHVLAASHEGSDVAKKFNEMGITAFVLKYRIPDDESMINKEIGPLQDAQRAIQIVRERAKEWKINPNHIGIMGFSAGGHLASTAGTHFKKSVIDNKNKISLRPDFMILVYPVISFSDSIGHIGSRDNLLGKNPSPEKIKEYSNELQVSVDTPPAFLIHAKDDDVVKVENSIDFYDALKKNKVSAEIYFFEKGGHGFGMNNQTSSIKWMDFVQKWISKNGW
ncbi:MAG: alpha/beta hydrolase [Bacteroidetes bacterium]|nr:alpha/beta hydrolase [Bacteroidota bacterium]